ncbi:NAD(P)-dependent alcohol dehydrogenase [Rhizobium rhizogenes]|uniref:NAD(P)-dependent alcohol dehydrogenase n=1 Tax=Rhizobium rhizogenes TaxID=359 RepID=UPI0004D5754F|nr:NAD(P)-dependent alcohol dehydrogenase [Rhizobium rhizogenes]KEA03705.1 sulfurtransferase [Rhizobium rhizogenes]MQB34900.1 NAD(P)-dependent alcohol dehydrogenase [Rhizobium rhizogenes]NTF70252.1 NAD(P)-dependent alcohol dehydrogenase [Rhizobium rhizogenes]NTI82845.1 NAD(P)-dependent alcohol dehydrogenase [Rhizobium rhizogenes]NTJ25026.1 NAD(P)-dependent alcohol dehydrogenase [Rhizobium rhizogenes]
MKALVLEEKMKLSLRDFPIEREEALGSRDVRIKLHTVGICGSDVHYYTHGGTGIFQVRAPMILGHEASGTVIEAGADVTSLKVGDRVCMEPGIPDPNSRATRMGMYNVDPAVRFWATPPIHGVLRPTVVHPADFTFKLPDNVSFTEAAMVEPLAVGVHAATKAQVKSGDIALVIGAGPIGLVTALSALAAGCAHVFVSDIDDAKLEIAAKLGAVIPINPQRQDLVNEILTATDGWGVEILFECSGHPRGAEGVFDPLAPGGRVVFIGSQVHPIHYDVGKAMVREARVEHVFRYAHVFPRCVAMLSSGAIDVKPLITRTFDFVDSVCAFETAASAPRGEVKMQIILPQ